MVILGLNYFYHDTTACIIVDGQPVMVIEEERLSREKHTWKFPHNAIDRCLQEAGLTPNDIDHVAVSIEPRQKWLAKAAYGLRHIRHAGPFLRHELLGGFSKQRSFWAWYKQYFKQSKPTVHNIPHHLAHVAGSFFISPYEEAALLSLDGAGEWSTSWLGQGKGNSIECFNQSHFPNSLGAFYEAVTEFCGFKPNYDEGKTMGLAPFGDAAIYYDRVKNIATVDDEGGIHIDLSYFTYQYWGWHRCSAKFYAVFGLPRDPKQEFEPRHEHVAAAFQKVLEECALKQANILLRKTKMRHLVIAGGVSLNSVMNGRIVRETDFDDIYVMPAAGDNGTALGAAYYVHNGILKNKRTYVHSDPFLGTQYGNDHIEGVLKECKLPYQYHENIAEETAKFLHAGKIIGWFQGRMEVGPRALGNRCILADPTHPDMKDKINREVKHREAYRPFAPAAIFECKDDFFELPVEAPFMLKVCQVKQDKQSVIPAVTHVDGSARLQTVRPEVNQRFYDLIKSFGDLSGVPILLNTSFNIMGEPVVEDPNQAIRCFYSTGLDVLVIGNYIVCK